MAKEEKEAKKRGFFDVIQNIDRRVIYVILFIILFCAMYWRLPIRATVTGNAERLYKIIEEAPDDKLIFIFADWGFGTQGENWPQFESIVHHCLKKGKKFAIMGTDPLAIHLHNQIVEDQIANLYKEKRIKREYGVDWVNFGFKPLPEYAALRPPYYVAFSTDIPEFVKKDYRNNDVTKLPIMRNVKNLNDFSFVFEVSAGLDGVYTWVGVIRPMFPNVKYGAAVTAVVAPDAYPYVNSGQLATLIDGYRGAMEYEELLGFVEKGRAHRQGSAQKWAHLFIIVLLFFGNLGYFITRKRTK